MHVHGIAFAAVLGLITLAFGKRGAQIAAIVICIAGSAFGLFMLFLFYCALRNLHS